MSLQEIKQKYKQILQQPSPNSQQSDQQWEVVYSRMKHQKRKEIQMRSDGMRRMSLSMSHGYNFMNEENIIKVKEKLAQAIANLNKKDTRIMALQTENIQSKEHRKKLQQQIQELQQKLQKQEQKIIDQQMEYSCLQKNMEKNLQMQKMDKELQQRQIQYYQTHIENLKNQLQSKDQKILELNMEIKTLQQSKNMVQKLQQDVVRLKQLLYQASRQKFLVPKIDSRQQILNNQSLNLKQVREQLKRKQIKNNLRKIRKNTVHYSIKTEANQLDVPQNSLSTPTFKENISIRHKILNEFKKDIQDLTSNNDLSKENLLKIVSFVIDEVQTLLQKQHLPLEKINPEDNEMKIPHSSSFIAKRPEQLQLTR